MGHTSLDRSAALDPPPTLSQSRGFDFLLGRWTVTHRKLRERLAGCRDWYEFPGTLDVHPILGGCGNFDWNVLYDPAGKFEASSLRLYDPAKKLWSIHWLVAHSALVDPPVVGRFDGVKGSFFSEDQWDGRPVSVRTTYEPLSAEHAQWTQAFAPPGSQDWEVNWVMDFRRPA